MTLTRDDPRLRLLRRRAARRHRAGAPAIRTNPKNRRRRCSILVERTGPGGTTASSSTPRRICASNSSTPTSSRLDAVLFTHDHADHTHGIDDLRPLVIHMRRRIPVYADAATSRVLHERFGYCFKTPPGSDYPPILDEHRIAAGRPVTRRRPGRRDHGDAVPDDPRQRQGAWLPVRRPRLRAAT